MVGEGDARTKAEVFESLVELATPVVPDATAVLADLARMRAEIAERATTAGLRVYAAGAHPLASGDDQEIVPLPRYEQMAASLGDVLRRQLVCGLHVHVSVPDPDTALRAFEAVVPWLPVLLALSANSPFAEGGDTGRRSERAERLLSMPTGGTPPVLRSWDDWRTATGRDSTRRHWDAWPRPEYGTRRGAGDGHADRRAQVGRLRRDRACPRLDDAGHASRRTTAASTPAAGRMPRGFRRIRPRSRRSPRRSSRPWTERSSSLRASFSTAGRRPSASSRSLPPPGSSPLRGTWSNGR